MADALISVVAERVTAIIKDEILNEVRLVRGVEKEVISLSDKLKTFREVVDDAETRGVKEPNVKDWLKKLENVAYEMDDVLDEWNYALLKHKIEFDPAVASSAKQKVCCSFIPNSSSCFKKVSVRRDIAKKIQNVKEKVNEIFKEKDEYNFEMTSYKAVGNDDSQPQSWRIQSASSIKMEKVRGRDVDRDNIVRKLTEAGDRQILSIVGMGGLGKTTLAQLAYNDSRVKDCFDLRIWICVSDPFDVAGIARGIVESVRGQSPPHTNQLDAILQILKESVSGKKFLLVLDDVWTEDYNKWEPLEIELKHGAPSSKILVTTRNERVAKMMGTFDSDIYRPQQLTDEECWSLLSHVSLSGRDDQDESRKFEDVGRKIACKCKGLPLAAIVLGSLLKFKKSLEEWENVLESEIWKSERAEVDIYPHLLLSYNELPPALKRCFSYCALYPEDSRINVERLIQMWMALGYLGSDIGNDGSSPEFRGRDYFDNLAMRSLFQDFEYSYHTEQIRFCKMHDIVHDFAQFLRKNDRVKATGMTDRSCQVCDPLLVSKAQEYRSLIWSDESPPNLLCGCLTSLRVLGLNRKLNGLPLGMERLIHLRWLDMRGTALSTEDLQTICKLYFLQTLMLASCSLKEIPEEIGKLVHLRDLDLSKNGELKELPESVCSLADLQTLNIENCSNLCKLPEEIHRIENLKHLFILKTKEALARQFPQGLAQLRRLRTLQEFHGGRGGNKMGMLKNLNHLTGYLGIDIHYRSFSDLEEMIEDAREAELRDKKHLQNLNIEFNDEGTWLGLKKPAASLWLEVMEALEPNQNLKCLRIWRYRGLVLPRWISSPLNLVKSLDLLYCDRLLSLPPLGKLPLLEELYLRALSMKVVGVELLGIRGREGSSSADEKEKEKEKENENENENAVAFPKLKRLIFKSCSEWEEWEDITAEEEESTAVTVMPCLTELNIWHSYRLKKLPHRLLHKAASLAILDIPSHLRECYQDKDASPWRSISQNNPHLVLK